MQFTTTAGTTATDRPEQRIRRSRTAEHILDLDRGRVPEPHHDRARARHQRTRRNDDDQRSEVPDQGAEAQQSTEGVQALEGRETGEVREASPRTIRQDDQEG